MITVVQSCAFMRSCEGKYSAGDIERLVTQLSANPAAGKKLQAAGNLYQLPWQLSAQGSHEYDVYYVFHSKAQPILIVNIFRKGTKAVLDKVLATLVHEITG